MRNCLGQLTSPSPPHITMSTIAKKKREDLIIKVVTVRQGEGARDSETHTEVPRDSFMIKPEYQNDTLLDFWLKKSVTCQQKLDDFRKKWRCQQRRKEKMKMSPTTNKKMKMSTGKKWRCHGKKEYWRSEKTSSFPFFPEGKKTFPLPKRHKAHTSYHFPS